MAPHFELYLQSSSSTYEDQTHVAQDEERKERNRQKVRRHYYRKLSMLNDLRTTVATLKEKYDLLVAIKDKSAAPGALALRTGSAHQQPDHLTLLKQVESVRKERLQAVQEHKLLQARVQDYVQVRQQVEELLLSEQVINTDEGRTALSLATKSLSAQECRAIGSQALEDVIALEMAPAFSNLDTNHMNWRCNQSVKGGVWKYRLSKTLVGFKADSLVAATWPILTNPATIASMYSTNVDMFCRLVQTVNESNVIMFQEYSSLDFAGQQVFMKSLFLMTKIETKNGFRLIMRSIDPQRMLLHERTGDVVWQDIFTWLTLERTGKDNANCICEIAGLAATVGSNADHWAVEILRLVTQWENLFCGLPFTVPPEP